ncbi:unnamed protein product [Sphagnum balticum]
MLGSVCLDFTLEEPSLLSIDFKNIVLNCSKMYLEAGRLHVRLGEKDEAINSMEMVDVGVLIPEDLTDDLQDIAGRG